MNHKEQYDLIVLFKSKTTAELHDMLMNAFNSAEKKLGEIQFTREQTIRETYEEFEHNLAPTIQNIWRLQSILAVREQNESRRMIYEKNANQMMPGQVMRGEYSTIMNNYYSNRIKEIKELTQIKHQNGDSTLAELLIHDKIENEERNERQFLNHVLLRYVLDIGIMRATIDKIDVSSSDMY